jgi:hypothetical protein
MEHNFRSACALGIVGCFVLFLAASAPHRVHHLFENPQADEVTRAHTHKTAYPLLLTALSQSADSGDHNHPSGDHEKSLAKDGQQDHVRGSHHGYASGNNHDRGRQHQGRAESQVEGESDGNGSDTPLQANTPHDDAHHDNSAQTVCLLQSAAQHSHLSTAQSVSIIFLKVEFEERLDLLPLLLSPFNPSPFSQRAPPKV